MIWNGELGSYPNIFYLQKQIPHINDRKITTTELMGQFLNHSQFYLFASNTFIL